MNSQICYNHIIEFDTSFHLMIYPRKSHTEYFPLEESTTDTHLMFYLIWCEVIIGLKRRINRRLQDPS